MSSTSAEVYNPFDKLPDDILLKIFHDLTDFDLSAIRKVNKRFESVAKDRELVKNVSFTGCYQASTSLTVNYLQPIKSRIESLNLNYCYWLSSQCCDTIARCANLVSLHLLHISMSAKRLVALLASLKKLERVSVTVKNVREFQTLLDKNPEAQETMRGVKVLTIQVKNQPVHAQMMTMHFLAVTSFFEYCHSLEEFHVQGLFCTKGIPPYVVNPQIKKLQNLKNIHTMSVSDAIDPFARMFFFGALLEVCRLPELQFRTLLQPLVVHEHLQRKGDFVACMKRIEHLENLDISQTNATIPNEVYQLERAVHLQYLNVADNSLIDSQSLHTLADNCHHLISINLRDCHHLHFKRPEVDETGHEAVDMSGLQSLVVNCTALRHINLSGVHIHSKDFTNTGYTSLCHLLALNTEWRSISISPCCLSSKSTDSDHTIKKGKRTKITHVGGSIAKRARLGLQAPDLNMSGEQELSTELGKLVSACPHVEQLELIGAGFRPAFSKRYISEEMKHFRPCSDATSVDEEDILCVRHWKKLRYLQLSAVPGINSGGCLVAIARGCLRLERLLVAHLGLSPMSSYQDKLLLALPLAHNLKDLRCRRWLSFSCT
ncbi:F-box/LRR-repeat protein 18-like isoform X2 [Littorina saxatilis]|uniref:F-box/LRR-repeat protein 18-like isoform X2 n=1 Tax=Littorina saxatilis TaxID=31220 RepID=UPI0038B4B055